MKTKHIILLGIFALCVTFFSACYNGEVTGVFLNTDELHLTVGDTATLIATVEPKDAENKEVSWKSSNSKIASVDKNGLVTAHKTGETTITATTKDGKKKDFCSVYVYSDYREKWVGDWEFKGEYAWSYGGYGPDIPYTGGDTTIYYSGTINLENNHSKLIINYRENCSLVMKVDESGKLFESPLLHTYSCNGQFEGINKVRIYYHDGGMGGGSSAQIYGTKGKKGGNNE